MTLSALTTDWRRLADTLDAHGCVEAAATRRLCADDLEAWLDELVDRAEAAALAHRSKGYIAARQREGALANHGTVARPLYRRRDLMSGKLVAQTDDEWEMELVEARTA